MLKPELIQLRKQVRIRDVAQAAGVSTTSVSRHLNGQIVLPRATAVRIDAAVQRLGYRPNAIARRLSRQKSETLGFVTTDIAYPFFAAVASAAEAEATRHGYSMAIFNSRNEMARELVFLSKIEDHQVDGILFLTNHVDDGTLSRQIARSGRVVLIDEDVKDAPAPRVFANNETGGALAGRHLIELGHRRIAYVSGPRGMISCEERYRGFSEVVTEAGAFSTRDSSSSAPTKRTTESRRSHSCGRLPIGPPPCSLHLICWQSASCAPRVHVASKCHAIFPWWASMTCCT